MSVEIKEYYNPNSPLKLRVARGHFATSHSHINYYVDLTFTKHRLSEAKEAARQLTAKYKSSTIIDTILCLDGTEVVGACMASDLTKSGFQSINLHNTVYVLTPEHTTGSQLIFRDNTKMMIEGKHVLILAASITTGYTVFCSSFAQIGSLQRILLRRRFTEHFCRCTVSEGRATRSHTLLQLPNTPTANT